MTLTAWIAIAVILVTVWALIKRFETRLTLMAAGLFLKGFAHDVHAEQEQSQTAQQRKDIE